MESTQAACCRVANPVLVGPRHDSVKWVRVWRPATIRRRKPGTRDALSKIPSPLRSVSRYQNLCRRSNDRRYCGSPGTGSVTNGRPIAPTAVDREPPRSGATFDVLLGKLLTEQKTGHAGQHHQCHGTPKQRIHGLAIGRESKAQGAGVRFVGFLGEVQADLCRGLARHWARNSDQIHGRPAIRHRAEFFQLINLSVDAQTD